MNIVELLNPKNTVSANRPLAHALGVNAALIYSALVSKYIYYKERGMLDGEGYFYSTANDLQESTALSQFQQKSAVEALVKTGLIECTRRGLPARRCFKINENAQLLLALIADGEQTMTALNPIAQKPVEQPCANAAAACNVIETNSAAHTVGQSAETQTESRENCRSTVKENAKQVCGKLENKSESNFDYTYNPNIKKSKIINPYQSIDYDEMDMMYYFGEKVSFDNCTRILHETLEYDCFPYEIRDKADEIVGIMRDVICSSSKTIRINSGDLPCVTVKKRFLELDNSDVCYVIDAMQRGAGEVRNIRSYLITALYNAPTTADNYYSAMYYRDFPR